ncbi:MAG: N-acetyltransferase [Citrobacter freundii]|nr:MAG: N-acetyltransferase [Citrobacter freundii]
MERFPSIETERLLLNRLTAEDVPAITQFADNPNIASRTLNLPHPYAEKDALFWISMAEHGFKSGSNFIFAIRLRKTGGFIGGMGLAPEPEFSRAEIGYWLAEPFWNQGFATEALAAMIRFGFEQLQLNKLCASHFKTNPASGRVMEKCGMIKEGELKEHVKKKDVYHDMVVYGLTRKDYFNWDHLGK